MPTGTPDIELDHVNTSDLFDAERFPKTVQALGLSADVKAPEFLKGGDHLHNGKPQATFEALRKMYSRLEAQVAAFRAPQWAECVSA